MYNIGHGLLFGSHIDKSYLSKKKTPRIALTIQQGNAAASILGHFLALTLPQGNAASILGHFLLERIQRSVLQMNHILGTNGIPV